MRGGAFCKPAKHEAGGREDSMVTNGDRKTNNLLESWFGKKYKVGLFYEKFMRTEG